MTTLTLLHECRTSRRYTILSHVQTRTAEFTTIVCVLFQRELDSEAQEVVKRQDESEVSRKKLVELSREFKRTSTEVRCSLPIPL